MYKKKTQSWVKHIDFIILDMLCLNVAFVAAYLYRHGWCSPYQDEHYVDLAVILTLVDFAVLVINETMKNVLRRGYFREFSATVKHVAMVEMIITLYLFATKTGATYSRIVLGSFAIFYVIFSYLVRLGWKRFLRHAKFRLDRSALYILTTCDQAKDVVARYLQEPRYLLVGICLLDADRAEGSIRRVPINTTRETVLPFLCREWVDEAVVSLPGSQPYPDELVDKLVEMGIVVHVEIHGSTRLEWQRQEIEKIAGKQVLTVGLSMATYPEIILKRTMDIVGGLIGSILTLMLTVIIGPMIFIKSPGPIFFTQTRVGKNGKQFKMYKFRSMYPDAEARKAELMAENRVDGGLMFKLDYDPRIIGCKKRPDGTVKKGIGNFIRDYSLDEFPQFFNVLKGDLSLVGTRPPTVDEWEKYDLHHRARLAIKPGITGMWQVSGRSKITDFEQVVELDKKYIREWSIGLDLRILLQTIRAVLKKDGSM